MSINNIYEGIKELLKKDPQKRFYTEEGVFIPEAVYSASLNLDSDLIELLVSNKKIKKVFFKTIGSTLVFDKVKFGWAINNKEFLSDSYTRFKNKIGLTDSSNKFISHSNDVVLSFPYKDCVLEGGGTGDKDEEKREEIFYNELLGADSIDCLLAPKVFCNVKQYSQDNIQGHNTNSFCKNDNLLICGNNLLALSSILTRYENKVKCIYIDPPYNTGSDDFNYNDSFNHSSWLVFMKNRLEIAKRLLKEDGVIFVQCDDNEQAYLKVLMDEIFGVDNFISNIIPLMNPRGRQESKYPIAQSHEYILCYSKYSGNASLYAYGVREVDSSDSYRELALRKSGNASLRTDRPNMYFPIYFDTQTGEIYIDKKDSPSEVEILPIKKDGTEGRWRWKKENVKNNVNLLICKLNSNSKYDIYEKDYLIKDGKSKGVKTNSFLIDTNIINDRAKEHLEEIFNNKNAFSYPKSEFLIQRMIEISTQPNDIVLDFFAGSGTTLSVALKMNRKFIGIEQMTSSVNLIIRRLVKVIDGEKGGISKQIEWHGGGSFTYCELAKLNQNYIDEIANAGSDPQLVDLYNKISSLDFISHTVNPKEIDNQASGFLSLSFDDKKKLLIELLDKNMLYINYSDISDTSFKLKDTDIEFTRSFYGK